MKKYLLEYKSRINFIIIILEILLVMMVAGMNNPGNRRYLYLLLLTIIAHYGMDLIIESRFTNKQKMLRFIIGIVIVVITEIILTQTNIFLS